MPVKLFVGGLSFSTSTDRLREAFARFGGVTSAAVMTDRETGRSRGFGFVEMASPEEAEQAIAGLNGFSLDGRTIRVDKATPRGAGGPRPAFTDRRSGPGRPPSGPRGGFGDRPPGGGGTGPGRGGFGDRSAPGRGPRPGGGGMPGDDRATAREPRRTSFGNSGRGQGQGDRRGPGGQREQKRPSSLKKGPGAQRRSEDRGRRSLGDESGGGYRPF